MTTLIERAEKWAAQVWSLQTDKWKEREQDRNYRDAIARPSVENVIMEHLPPVKDGIYVDLGCGDGSETLYFRKVLDELGHVGIFYGYDPQPDLIPEHDHSGSVPVQFVSGDITDVMKQYDITGRADLITSLFVLQDVPDVFKYIKTARACLKENGTGIFLFVHPDFAFELFRRGKLRPNSDLDPAGEIVPWNFAGLYPIVEPSGNFSAPYFHRTVDEYCEMFRKTFGEVYSFGIKPSRECVNNMKREGKSPFANHEGNVYYPEINEQPSGMIVVVKK